MTQPRKTKTVRLGLELIRPIIAIALETPSDDVNFDCRCGICRTGGDGCLCHHDGRGTDCQECVNLWYAEKAFEWLDAHVF